jgi:hypothetical protein
LHFLLGPGVTYDCYSTAKCASIKLIYPANH